MSRTVCFIDDDGQVGTCTNEIDGDCGHCPTVLDHIEWINKREIETLELLKKERISDEIERVRKDRERIHKDRHPDLTYED